MNGKNTTQQYRRLRKQELSHIYSTLAKPKNHRKKAEEEFKRTPTCYYSGKKCVHKSDKPCNPSCLLWADCSHGKKYKDG